MEALQKKRYFRLIYAKALHYFAYALAASAFIAGLYGGVRLYFVFALCAAGCAFLAWSWFTHLHAAGFFHGDAWKKKRRRPRVPYLHRRDKTKLRRPSFAMDNTDFDDDLVSATACNEAEFEPEQQERARVLARAACGLLLILVSLVIPM